MSIKTRLNPMGAGTYLLTIITNPSYATCTLTYNGKSYETKTLKVVKGSTVNYVIYESTYGFKTGTVTVDRNRTLIFTGYNNAVHTDVAWTRPNLSTNGTMGGSSCAASGDASSNSYPAWKAFDNNTTSTGWISKTTNTGTLYFYSPTPIKVVKVYLTAYATNVNTRVAKAGKIYGSNDNSNYTSLGSWSNNTSKTWTVKLTNSTFYKYYKISVTANANSGYAPGFYDVAFNAYTDSITYNTGWSVSG